MKAGANWAHMLTCQQTQTTLTFTLLSINRRHGHHHHYPLPPRASGQCYNGSWEEDKRSTGTLYLEVTSLPSDTEKHSFLFLSPRVLAVCLIIIRRTSLAIAFPSMTNPIKDQLEAYGRSSLPGITYKVRPTS